MKTQRIITAVSAMLIYALSVSVFAGDTVGSEFVASRVYQSAGPIYGLAGGEFDLGHDGMEIACLNSDGSMLQLSPNFLAWEVSLRYEGRVPITEMTTRPTIGIGDVHSGYPGSEVVLFNRHPSVVTVVFHDPNSGWSHDTVSNNIGWTGNGWGARVGDYDPYRPGDEIFYIYESPFDFSNGRIFKEIGGFWIPELIYGAEYTGEVGMDSAAGDFNWDHTGPEIVIVTEMGPTYQLVAPQDAPQDANQSDWPRRTIWNDADNAGWVTKIADVDPWSPGNEIVYGTRYSNRIMMSRHNGDRRHDPQVLFTGNAIGTLGAGNMWDIAVGDVLLRSPGLEILGVDDTGSVYLVQRTGDTWEGQVIWQDSRPLYAVTVGDFLPERSGDEILVAGKSGAITILIPTPRGIYQVNEKPGP